MKFSYSVIYCVCCCQSRSHSGVFFSCIDSNRFGLVIGFSSLACHSYVCSFVFLNLVGLFFTYFNKEDCINLPTPNYVPTPITCPANHSQSFMPHEDCLSKYSVSNFSKLSNFNYISYLPSLWSDALVCLV